MKRITALLLLVVLFGTLCVAPATAENLDSYFSARFNKSPAFYTGPGSDYYRANNGKAQYGGGGVARVYGTENGWLLLGYETAKGNYRIGYFQDKYLSNMTVVSGSGTPRKLNFEYRSASITSTCQITDDPVIKNEPFATLQRGQNCTYLASMGGSWAYIELSLTSEKKKARGFVPMNAISFSYGSGGTNPTVITNPTTFTNDYTTGVYAGGTWVTAATALVTYSGPGTHFTYTGTFHVQNQSVYCLSKYYDSTNYIWWVLCRFSDGNGPQYVWTYATNFINSDWLLSRLLQE